MPGADSQQTLKQNELAFKRLRIRPRMLQGIKKVDMSVTVFDKTFSMPILIAPTAMQKLAHEVGEKGTVRAANTFNTAMFVSTVSTTSFKEVRNTCPNALLITQTYFFKDKETLALLKQAEDSGYSAIAVTVDSPVIGFKRENERYIAPKFDVKNQI